jgi:glyoxylase-like metal-dependent hydrolase (beta-lactamase superfamily II)
VSPALHTLAPGLTFIQRGWLSANHLAWAGERPVVVDTGYLDHCGQTLELLRRAGVEPAAVAEIVTTHLHCDHVGAHAELHRLSGCRIALSGPCRRAAQRRDSLASWHGYYGQAYRWFPTHRTIEPGSRLALGGLEWEAVEAPGHAAGQLCLFAPETGWLFSADAVWDADFGVLTTRVEGWAAPEQQAATLERLARLPVTTVLPGHGPPLPDGPGAIAACRERIAAFLERPELVGRDQVRKILLYTVLMRGPLTLEELTARCLELPWLAETCARYFDRPPAAVAERFCAELAAKGLLATDGRGRLTCTLPA